MTQSIWASLSTLPSRLVTITSTASNGSVVGVVMVLLVWARSLSARHQIVRSEGLGEHVRHRDDPAGHLDQEVRPAVLPQELAAPTAGHQVVACAVDAGEGDQTAAPTHVQGGHERALRAQAQPV